MIDAIATWWDSWTAIDRSCVRSLFSVAWGFGTVDKPNWLAIKFGLPDDPLYWNGIFFLRITAPFGIFWMIRWGGADADPALFQSGLGYDFKGRFRIINRIQSDASARAGTTIPNDWEVTGWTFGGH